MRYVFALIVALLVVAAVAQQSTVQRNFPASTVTVSPNVAAITSLTNVIAYNAVYSNGISAAESPLLQPLGGGVFVGLRITNSPTVSAATEQIAMGIPVSTAITTKSNYWEFRDCVFWSDNGLGDAVSWKPNGGSQITNRAYFYDCLFHSSHYCFNLIQESTSVGFYDFKGCDFEAIHAAGTSDGDGSCAGFMPDQGPLTNKLEACHFTTRGATLGAGILIQIKSYNWLNGCHFDVISTNANSDNTAIALSGEGNYIGVFNNCHFHLEGPGTNAILDCTWAGVTDAGINCTLIFNNCFYDGANSASGGWLINNPTSLTHQPTILVTGGNIGPTNFVSLNNVTFVNPNGSFMVGNTNLGTAAPDMTIPVSIVPTAVGLTFTALKNVDASGSHWQHCIQYITNSAASTITLTAPANARLIGSTTVTRLSQVDWWVYGLKFTNGIITTIF